MRRFLSSQDAAIGDLDGNGTLDVLVLNDEGLAYIYKYASGGFTAEILK